MGRVAAAALLIAAAMTVSGAARAASDRERFSLGVLRRDGLLVPFASFDGKRWQVPWPDTTYEVPRPIGLGDVPPKWWGAAGPDAPWTAWLPEAQKRPLKLERPVSVRVFCTEHFGVLTDYRGGPFDPREPSVPKDALASAGDVAVEPITSISLHSPDAAKLIAIIAADFNKAEQRASELFTEWKHPYAPEARRKFPIVLEAFYRSSETTPKGTWRVSYIEAVRHFPPSPVDDNCGLITFVRGWVLEREGKPAKIDVGARVAYCDRNEVSFMLPFGRIHVAGEAYWVYQVSSWRDEYYSVARVRPDDVRPVVATQGGSCPRR
jgi:hypothetical protein